MVYAIVVPLILLAWVCLNRAVSHGSAVHKLTAIVRFEIDVAPFQRSIGRASMSAREAGERMSHSLLRLGVNADQATARTRAVLDVASKGD